MLHTKFQDPRPLGSGEEDFQKFLPYMGAHIWAWQPSWSCDLNYLYTLSFPLPIKFGFDWPSGFRGEDL